MDIITNNFVTLSIMIFEHKQTNRTNKQTNKQTNEQTKQKTTIAGEK